MFERSSQLLKDCIKICESDRPADVQEDCVLLSLGSLKVFPLAEHAGVFDGAELVDIDGDAAVEKDEEREANADLQTGVDVHDDDGQEGADPEESVQLWSAGELWKVVDLHEHALQGDHDDGGENGLEIIWKQILNVVLTHDYVEKSMKEIGS